MRRIGDLMKEMGFNSEAPESTQKAFFQHLVEAARVSKIDRKIEPIAKEPQQLSFDFKEEESVELPKDHLAKIQVG